MRRPIPSIPPWLKTAAIAVGWALLAFLSIRLQTQYSITLGPRWLLAGAFGVPLAAAWFGGWHAVAAVTIAALVARGDGTFSWIETLAGVVGMYAGGAAFLLRRSLFTGLKPTVEHPSEAFRLIAGVGLFAGVRGLTTGLAGMFAGDAGQAALGAAAIEWLALAFWTPIAVAVGAGLPRLKGWRWAAEGVLGLAGVAAVTAVMFAGGAPITRDLPLVLVVLLGVLGTWVTWRFDVFGAAVVTVVVFLEALALASSRGQSAPLFPGEMAGMQKDFFLALLGGVFYTQLLVAVSVRAWATQTARLRELNERERVQSVALAGVADERLRQRDELAAMNRLLAEQRARLDAVFAHLPVGVYVLEPDGKTVRRLNRSIRIPGLDDAIESLTTEELGWVVSLTHADGRPSPVEDWPIVRAFREGEVIIGESMRIDTAAGTVTVAVTASPIRDEAGLVVGAVAIVLDLTRQEEATQAVRDSEDRLRFALKSAGMITWDVDLPVGRVSRSESLREWLGLPPAGQDLTGDEFLTHVHPDDREFVREAIPRFRNGDGDRIEYRMVRGDGSVAWLSSSGWPVFGPDGKVTRAVGVHRDVTAERTSRDRLHLLESAVVHAHDAVVILDGSPTPGSGRVVLYVNDAFCRMTGYDRDDVIGRSLHLLRGPASDASTLDTLRAALDAGQPHRVELLNYRKDGAAYWVDLALEPVRDNGRIRHWVMIQRDVTRRRRAEDRLRESEEKFRGIFENAWAGVSITDAAGRFVSVNPAFADLVGRPLDDLLGRSPRDITHPDDWAAQEPLTLEVAEGVRDRYQIRKRYVRPDGTIVWSELWLVALHDHAGRFRYGLGISVDVTERLRLEEQLRQAQKMEAFGQLAGGVAHDFNNLLTAVLGNLALVRMPPGDPNRALLAAADLASSRAADLTRKLLGYARRTHLYLAPVRVGEVIEEVVGILRRTFDPRVVIRADVGPTPEIRADATLVNQVLFNLCLNSRDAIDGPGEVVLTAEGVEVTATELDRSPDAQAGAYVRVTVRDTGRGMDEDVRRRIFEPFFTTKAVGQGTGLGLAMVHGIMKQHGGWVSCESTPGAGTRFDLFFPVSPSPMRAAEAVPASTPPPAVRTPPPVSPQGTVLLVDDEAMIRAIARAVLESAGFAVIEAEDGIDAVEKFREGMDEIDLVLLDLTMPRMSGRDAFRQIIGLRPGTRVLFSSGYTTDDVSELGQAAGMLSKPYRPDNLLAAVRKALARDLVEA